MFEVIKFERANGILSLSIDSTGVIRVVAASITNSIKLLLYFTEVQRHAVCSFISEMLKTI